MAEPLSSLVAEAASLVAGLAPRAGGIAPEQPTQESAAQEESAQKRAAQERTPRGRILIGIAGSPGSGKTSLVERLLPEIERQTGLRAASVPMDGFHLADVTLDRLGLPDRKGAPETFDRHGYARLLATLAARPEHTVYAPGFERGLEQPIAASVAVGPEVDVVVTEGNYLLLDGWEEVRAQLDRVLFLPSDAETRHRRLLERHVRFGKSAAAAEEWIRHVDEPNARLVEHTASRADRLLG